MQRVIISSLALCVRAVHLTFFNQGLGFSAVLSYAFDGVTRNVEKSYELFFFINWPRCVTEILHTRLVIDDDPKH